jgi:hypothetical protein
VLANVTDLLQASWRPFAKAILPAVAAVAVAVVSSVQSGGVNASALAVAVTGVLAAVLIYFVPNVKDSPALKTFTPAAVALIGAIVTWAATGDGEALRVALSGLGAAVLAYSVPNRGQLPKVVGHQQVGGAPAGGGGVFTGTSASRRAGG